MSERAWRTYRLFGLVLASDFPFASRLPAGAGRPDLTFTCAGPPPIPDELPAPVYASRFRTARGESNCSFYRLAERDLLRFPGVGDFYLGANGIVCHPADPDDFGPVEVHLLGTVLSCWLERSGVPSLHASAVVAAGGRTVGFLSSNGGGKSSLAAAMMEGGWPLLTDDVLAVESGPDGFSGRHGYPQMRLWPEAAKHFCGPAARLPRLHRDSSKLRVPVGAGGFGAFAAAERPLSGFYLPVRRPGAGGEVRVEALAPRAALIELVRHSFVGALVEAAGWQPRRFDVLARLAVAVPVKRLTYPSGLEHLPRVREAILADLEAAAA
ncbi:MAG TPA: hypothetical protein VGC93_18965 [Thermoanaerobaculia bacterium]